MPNAKPELQIRQATEEDIPVLRELFDAGVFEGEVQINDTGADIEQLDDAYFCDAAGGSFWVATNDDEIAGMIGVQRVDDSAAEMRRLRVRPQFRRQGVATALMEHAIRFCRDRDYLKIVLDVRVERQPAIQLFEKFGFYLSRVKEQEGHRTLDFFVDLYSDPNTE
ncbi:MAG: GNAT family N-acetyltransferase [Phycisphaerales bacterium]|nr:GNAT family N-acetyltransferase [Phycisphaerales bacterium]